MLSLSGALKAQLEVALRAEGEAGVRRVLAAYRDAGLGVEDLYVASPALETLGSLAGSPPETPDAGLRSALYGKQQYADVTGELWGHRWVEVTTPLAPQTEPPPGRATRPGGRCMGLRRRSILTCPLTRQPRGCVSRILF